MKQNHSKLIINYFDSLYKNPKCMLKHRNNFEFLVAVSLSAQTTDEKVNSVTPILFSKYKKPLDLSLAKVSDVRKIINPLGLANNKSKNIISLSNDLVRKYNGRVPNNKEALMSLKGVGNKTANLVLGECFNKATFPVDTHINRISKRLNIANENDDILIVEDKLKKYFLKEKWNRLHHQFIYFGRDICKSRNPKCDVCKLKTICGKASY